jgi:hypothetical protein
VFLQHARAGRASEICADETALKRVIAIALAIIAPVLMALGLSLMIG